MNKRIEIKLRLYFMQQKINKSNAITNNQRLELLSDIDILNKKLM